MKWFTHIFGISEKEYQDSPEKIKIKNSYLHTPAHNYQLGNFNNIPLYLLRKIASQYLKSKEEILRATPEIVHICCQKYGSESLISIMNRNPKSLFQVASKFNCLEFTQPPEKGITDYIFDETQGPQCALATAPSTFYRNYLIPISNEKIIYGQTSDTQINNLDLTEMLINNSKNKYWSVDNGMITQANNLQLLNKYITKNKDLVRDTIKVGLLTDSDLVIQRRTGPQSFIFNQKPFPKISQVYCSAISCGMTNISEEFWEPLATTVLEAIYEATIWAGFLNYLNTGNNCVFLTFVGGGVFANKLSWILSAINRAVGISKRMRLPLKLHIVHFQKINDEIKKIIE